MAMKKVLFVAVLVSSLIVVSTALASQETPDGGERNHIVLYNKHEVPAVAANDIAQAGWELVYSYDAIGVAIARSTNATLDSKMAKVKRVHGVSGWLPANPLRGNRPRMLYNTSEHMC